jgi:hypothetical protein
MTYGSLTIRLMLAALAATWTPVWCNCASQGAGKQPSHAGAETPTGGHSCCQSRAKTTGHDACNSPGQCPSQGHNKCTSCGKDLGPLVEPAAGKPVHNAAAPVLAAFIRHGPALESVTCLPASGAYPFDTADGPAAHSLIAQSCQLTT